MTRGGSVAMFPRIIVGYDGRPESEDALALGRLLAELTRARLILADVLPVKEEPIGRAGYEAALREDSERPFAGALARLQGVDVEARALGDAWPADALRELAERERADAIVVGSTERGPLGRIYPGSVAERLLHGAPCAVAVAPRGYASRAPGEPRVIAVAFDGSPESQEALATASKLGLAAKATLRVVAVHEPFRPATAATAPLAMGDIGAVTQRDAMEERLGAAVRELPGDLRAKGLLLRGDAAAELLAEAELGVDLIVMGSRGFGPLRRVMLGGVSSKVIRSSPCPVLVVPRSAKALTADLAEPEPASVGAS